MFFPEGRIRVHLYGQPCDMRKSFDGLQALVRHGLSADPLDGCLYCFINRRATQMRVLYFDRSGFCIWAKRLEAGRFLSDWSRVRTREMDFTDLKMLLEGIEPARVRKRYRLPSASQSSVSLSNASSNTSDPLPFIHGSSPIEQAPEPS
jgi:transposase